MKVRTHLSISRTLKETSECTSAIRNEHFVIDSNTFLGLPLQKEKERNDFRVQRQIKTWTSFRELQTRRRWMRMFKCLRNEPGSHIFLSHWLIVKQISDSYCINQVNIRNKSCYWPLANVNKKKKIRCKHDRKSNGDKRHITSCARVFSIIVNC